MDVPSLEERIQIEEVRFTGAVSESLAQKLGGTMNFILDHYVIPVGHTMESYVLEVAIGPGWLPVDGRAVSRITYADLFAVLGTRHGTGDGATTFNLPDERGRFTRMVDLTTQGQAAMDPGHAGRTAPATGTLTSEQPGSLQAADIGAHTHPLGTQGGGVGSSLQSSGDSPTYSQNTGSSAGTETRPINIYKMVYIKT